MRLAHVLRTAASLTLAVVTTPLARAQAPCATPSELPAPLTYTDDLFVQDLVPGPTADSLYVGGMCFCGGGGPSGLVYLVTPAGWSALPLPPMLQGNLRHLRRFDLGSGPELHAYGFWTSFLGGPPISRLLRWNGASFVESTSPLGIVDDFETFDDGSGARVYAATSLGVERWNGSAWMLVGTPGGTSPFAVDLEVHDDGTGPALYVGGTFDTIDGVATGHVARWDGVAWSAVGAFPSQVTALHSVREESGPALYASGPFTTVNGVLARGLARFDGVAWSAAGGGLPSDFGAIHTLSTFDDGTGRGPELIASGAYAPMPGGSTGGTAHPVMRRRNGAWEDMPAFVSPGYAWNGGPHLTRPDTGAWIGGAFAPGSPVGAPTIAVIAPCDLTGRLYCSGDGATIACPCSNGSPVGQFRGCVNSTGASGTLRARGAATLSGDTLRLDGTGMPDGPVLYYQGAKEIAPFVFGDGIACTGGPFVRLRTLVNTSGSSSNPPLAAPALSAQGFVAAPGTRYYQARYRDGASFCTSATFSYTNGVAIVWRP